MLKGNNSMGGAIYNLCSELKDKFDKDFEWTKFCHFIEIQVVLFPDNGIGFADKQYSSGDIQLVQKHKKSLVIDELEKYAGMYINNVLICEPLLNKEQTTISLRLKSGITTFKSDLISVFSDRNIFKRIEIEKEKGILESMSSNHLSSNSKVKRM